jgi:type I restriction enzyme M protein
MTLAPTNTGHLTQKQLEPTLWRAANALRGPLDPGDFKAYVFPVLFFKWISDTWDHEHERAVGDFGDDLADEVEADYHTFTIPRGCHWNDVDSVSVNVGAKLATTLQRIQQANPTTLAGVFGDVNWAIRTGCPKLPWWLCLTPSTGSGWTRTASAVTCSARRPSTFCASLRKRPARRPGSSSRHVTSCTCL